MGAGGNVTGGTRTLASRYWPFLAVIAVVVVAATLSSGPTTVTVAGSSGARVGSSGVTAGAGSTGTAQPGSSAAADLSTGSGGSLASGASGSGTAGGATAGSVGGGGGGTGGAVSGAGEQLDAIGRPLSGDRSRCAPGGQLQEGVTTSSPPCIPALAGGNGGATSPGVTGNEITLVMVNPEYQPGVQQGLEATNLTMTPQQSAQADATFTAFLNKHYNFYGRKLKVIESSLNIEADDATARATAKQIQAQYHPFGVIFALKGDDQLSFSDQLNQEHIVNVTAGPQSDPWFQAAAPYAWTVGPQGFRAADMLADYWCKKMYGKNATLAGDPTYRLKKRKLGIVTFDNTDDQIMARYFQGLVSGRVCGSAADRPAIYTASRDQATFQQEAPGLALRMKNDGITTQTSVDMNPGFQADDGQQYYPENLMSGQPPASDTDNVGRFYAADSSSPNQMSHTFGIGWYAKPQPIQQWEFMKGAHDVDPSYTPPFVAESSWSTLDFMAKLLQYAGPHLTPQNVEAGAHNSWQLGGYTNAHPWAGWKCCSPYVIEDNPGLNANSFSEWADAREVYWSNTAVSVIDGEPGSYVCVNDCRRYQAGQWPRGDPEK